MSELDSGIADCLRSWNHFSGSRLQIQAADLGWNLKAQKLVNYEARKLAGIPVLVATASAEGLAAGLSAHSLWLSLWGELQKTGEFIDELYQLARASQKKRLVFGADEFHFLPGIPTNIPKGRELIRHLREHQWTLGEVFDLVGRAGSQAALRYIDEGEELAKDRGWTVAALPVASAEVAEPPTWAAPPTLSGEFELDELDRFLHQEFPGRWHREFNFWRGRHDTACARWLGLWIKRKLAGFVRIAHRGDPEVQSDRRSRWIPGALRLPLAAGNLTGEGGAPPDDRAFNDGCLGPIGVAKALRGCGAGRVLLAGALSRLNNLGVDHVCIDWTDNESFYKHLGFERVRTYRTAFLSTLKSTL
ncbi:MAG: hypothetical protein C5B49_09820 [Bdellovibrio sp.]|nr:MAG: hypothetical protein C5B49_09820 [Bdellovibrio sp.]